MHLASDDYELAYKELKRFLKKNPEHPEAVSLLSRIYRANGDLEAYFQTLLRLEARGLAETGELVGAVVTLLLDGRTDDAKTLATKAEFTAPEHVSTHLALFEIHMHSGQHHKARANLLKAMTLKENPDAYLMRRSRLSLTEDDYFGTATLLRRRLALYPSDGFALWAYGLSVPESNESVETFRQDMARALSRLHSDRLPFDFAAAANLILDETEASQDLMKQGLERDCRTAALESDAANCEAWYLAMADTELPRALTQVTQALELDPHRPDYLDTLAVVHWRMGDLQAAEAAAVEAVRLSPSDTYHLWQLDRIRVIRSSVRSTP
jgi:tetratricopeptide (TPR) repeat protein